MLSDLLSAAAALLLAGGVFFSVVGGIGLLRLPDLFARLHAGGVTDTAGAGLTLGGLMLISGVDLATLKLLTILFFLLVTSPTSAHALAKAALSRGMRPQGCQMPDEEVTPSKP